MNGINILEKYLKSIHLKIDFTDLKFQLKSHPNYPSILAFHETLSYFDVDNLVVDLPEASMKSLPYKFLTFLKLDDKLQLVFIDSSNGKFRYYFNGRWQSLNQEKFFSTWNTIILVINERLPQESRRIKFVWKSQLLFYLSLLLFTFFIGINSNSLTFTAIIIIAIIGAYLSFVAFQKKNKMTSFLGDKLCATESFYSCNKILSNDGGWLRYLSDISMIFFGFQILFGLFSTIGSFENFYLVSLKWISLFPPLLISYSIYHQIKVKNFCKICLLIAGVAVLQTIILFNFFNGVWKWILDIPNVLLGIISLGVVIFFWKDKRSNMLRIQTLSEEIFELNRFKRNFGVFKSQWENQNSITIEKPYHGIALSSGNKLEIILITNPFCKYCEAAHEEIKFLYEKFRADISLYLVFNIPDNLREGDSKYIHYKLLEIFYSSGVNEFLDALSYWYSSKNIGVFKSQYGEIALNQTVNNKCKEVLKGQRQLNNINNIKYTPSIFINKKALPKSYTISDIRYFMHDLIAYSSDPITVN